MKSLRTAPLGPVAVLMFIATAAEAQPGRILTAPGNNNIIECNLDASNCFTVVANQISPTNGIGFTQANSPSVSANGTIAFTSLVDVNGNCDGPCNPHVFIMDPDGTNVRQLTFNTNTPGYNGERYPMISPDGTTVAFLTNTNTAPDSSQPTEIYLVNVDGTNFRQLTPFQTDPNGNSQGFVSGFAWSPNSKTLAFRGVVYTSVCGTYFNNPIFVNVVGSIGADGSNQQVLACDNNDGYVDAIDWSHDGTLLGWTRNVQHCAQGGSGCVGEPAIAFYDLSGQNRYSSGITSTQLTGSASGDSCQNVACIHFSPDSSQLAYQNQYPGGTTCGAACSISIISLDGTSRTDTTIPVSAEMWWMNGPAIPAAASMTLAPANLEFWPGFSQQLFPSLLDGGGNLIMHTAGSYGVPFVYAAMCIAQIGPYGLLSGYIYPGNTATPSYINASNAGQTGSNVPFICWPSQPCTYTLSFNSENFDRSGGLGSVNVVADPGQNQSTCPWNATSNAPWITIASPAYGSGAGTGTINFTVAANNTGASREGTITVNPGGTLTVDQSGVSSTTLESITVSPSSASVPAGLTQRFSATGHYSDGSTQNLTTSVTWSSSNTAIATVSNASGSQGLATGVAQGGPVTITATLNSISGTAQLTVTTAVLQSITVSPTSASVAAGLTQQFSATGHYSDNSSRDLTASVTWSSSNTSVATISNSAGSQGLARGAAAGGPVTITATQNAISGTAQLTVTAPALVSMAVTPTNPAVPAGSTQQFTANGTYSDGSVQNISSSATWASSNTAVATITASGLASALAAGTTSISAKQGAISNSTTMTVITLQSVTISPPKPTIFVGSTLQLSATGHYSDGSTRDLTSVAAWSSSKTSVATITSPGGLATGVSKGSTTINAVVGAFSASTTLTVNAVVLQSITVTPASATIPVGGTQQFKATGNYSDGTTQDLTNSANWSSSRAAVASVSSSGLATGRKAGTAAISAKSGSVTGSATLIVQ